MSKARLAALVVSAAGALFVAGWEGDEPVAYLDPIGIPTVCHGHTATAKLGQEFTKEQCLELLQGDLEIAARAVRRLVKVPLTQPQFDALVSFTYNVGEGNLASSTLLRKLNAGDYCGAASEFKRWNRAGGRVLRGLTNRRIAEANYYLQGSQCGKTS